MNGVQAAIFSGSAMILLVLALRLFLKKHLPRGIFPTLWCAAAVRLLLPITIPTHLSVWNLLHTPATAQANGVISDVLTPFPSLATNSITEPAADAAGIRPMLLVWLVCAILLAAYFVIGYACMVRRFRGTRLAPQPSIDALLDRFRFSRDPHICVSNSRRAPLTFGVFRPTVLLPEDLPVGDAQFQLILAHELAHIRRKDCLRKLLLTVCLCLYWWNPLVWLMVWLANRDMELACDEAVLRALGPDHKKAYALTLLDMAQRNPKSAPLCSGFAKSGTEERILAILRFKRVPAWAAVFASALFFLSAGVFATQAVPEQSAAPVITEERSVSEPEKEDATQPQISAPELESSPEPEILPEGAPSYVFPLENADAAVNDSYGWREHPVSKNVSFHSGVDLDAPAGSNVLAVADGTVLNAEYNQAYGYFVLLEHEDGAQTFYAHMQELLANPGDEVKQGQIIGLVGSSGWATGPHLHLGVYMEGEAVDPLEALESKS